jgi:hypothetical protein
MMVPGIFKIFIFFPVLILLLLAVIGVIVLLIKLCSKRPWMAVIMALGLFLLIVPLFILIPSKRSVSHHTEVSMPSTLPASQETTTTIWLPGIEDEFEANIYPSKLSAVRSLGLHIDRSVQQVLENIVSPDRIILFQGAHNREFVEEFGRAIERVFPETNWTIKPETAAVQENEVAIRLDIVDIQTQPIPWRSDFGSNVTSGRIEATAMAKSKQSTINARFVEKPWVEDFSGFLNNKPNSRFIIAKSAQSCLTESEANRQAMESACNQVTEMLKQTSHRLSVARSGLFSKVNSNDILEGCLVLDRFVQSFEGAAGKIWRQALLVDVSVEKLKNLARRKAIIARARKTSFARMLFSIVGLIVLITVVYAFLNAATKGYYAWSLRIAGVVFALVVIILLLV